MDSAPVDQAAFFATLRAEQSARAEERRSVVPRSFTAAFLAGLVVGCALAGFDVTGEAGAARVIGVASRLGLQVDTGRLLPALILLGLIGGARAAAISVLVVNTLLNKAGSTGHAAYALSSAAAAGSLAGVMFAGFGHVPAHGWIIELVAGAGSGLLYRVFAGARARVFGT